MLGAWRTGKSSGEDDGGGRVVIGGTLVKCTDFVGAGAGVCLGGTGAGTVDREALARKYLKKLSCVSGKPSDAGKFSVAQKALYVVMKVLN